MQRGRQSHTEATRRSLRIQRPLDGRASRRDRRLAAVPTHERGQAEGRNAGNVGEPLNATPQIRSDVLQATGLEFPGALERMDAFEVATIVWRMVSAG